MRLFSSSVSTANIIISKWFQEVVKSGFPVLQLKSMIGLMESSPDENIQKMLKNQMIPIEDFDEAVEMVAKKKAFRFGSKILLEFNAITRHKFHISLRTSKC